MPALHHGLTKSKAPGFASDSARGPRGSMPPHEAGRPRAPRMRTTRREGYFRGFGSMHPKLALQRGVAVAAAMLLAGCFYFTRPRAETSFRSAPPPSAEERYCAWFGHARGGVLYFGEAAFWSTFQAAGRDPRADLRLAGPQLIGRFDLTRRALLEPLDVTAADARSGVWDVLAHDNGRIYFTTFYELSGSVDPVSGEIARFAAAGVGLNELARGPDGSIVASRYAGPDGTDGSLVLLAEDGRVLAEHALTPVRGHVVAAKSVAWDPGRDEFWVNTDLLPSEPGPVRHDARVLDRSGREQARISEPEVQFMAFRTDGLGVLAEVDAAGLWLRILRPDDPEPAERRGRRILADEFFEAGADFAQDIQFTEDGRAVVTRWSGRLHVLEPELPLSRTLRLPRFGDGLFYTGALHEERVCATLCADVGVVCREAAGFAGW